jgi:hypothetical protein
MFSIVSIGMNAIAGLIAGSASASVSQVAEGADNAAVQPGAMGDSGVSRGYDGETQRLGVPGGAPNSMQSQGDTPSANNNANSGNGGLTDEDQRMSPIVGMAYKDAFKGQYSQPAQRPYTLGEVIPENQKFINNKPGDPVRPARILSGGLKVANAGFNFIRVVGNFLRVLSFFASPEIIIYPELYAPGALARYNGGT